MARAISYFVFSSNGSYLRWDDDLIIGFTIRQYQMSITGGSGVDRLYAGAGTQVDATGLFASAGVDQLYLSGNFSDYTQTVSSSGVYTFTGLAGGAHAGEVLSFSMTSSGDQLVFADKMGTVQLSTYLNTQTNSFATILATQLQSNQLPVGRHPDPSLGAVPGNLPAGTVVNPASGAVPGDAASKVFVFDSGGINIPQLPIVGESIAITGGSGVDSFYVRKGTNADATGLFASASVDVLYLTGKFADYTQSVSSGGVYTFTRTFTGADLSASLVEAVSFSMTSSGDKLVFADGGATLQLSHYLVGSSFAMILATDLVNNLLTPGLLAAPTLSLLIDSGSNTSDGLTNNSTVNVTGLAQGTTWQYQVDGSGAWVSATASGTSATFIATSGAHSYTVQQTDLAGNTSPVSTAVTYTLDTTPPAMPTLGLAVDTGSSSSDGITSNPTINLTGLESGATWQYRVDTGVWQTGTGASFFNATSGAHSYIVQQTDTAGNTSSVSTAVTYTLDTSAPATPILALASDTGTNHSDGLTNNATISVTGLESGATWQYQVDGSGAWVSATASGTSATFIATSGAHSYTVQQTDLAGNTSPISTAIAYTLDTSASAPSLSLASDTGSSSSDGITSNPTINVGALEAGASWQYQVDGTAADSWQAGTGSSFIASTGRHSYFVRQIDTAGNTGAASTTATYTLDTSAPSAIGVAGTTGNVDENSVGAVTLTANANDVAANASVTWSLGATSGANNDTGLFNLTNGVLSFKPANPPDFEMPRGTAFNASTNSNAYTVNVIATDAAGNATTQAIVVNVQDINETPVPKGTVPDQTATQDVAYSFNVSTYFSDPDSVNSYTAPHLQWGTLTYTTSNTLPSGFFLDSNTGVISGTATSTTASAATITVTATDGDALSATQTFTLGVINGVNISHFTVSDSVGNSQFGKLGDTLTFTVTMSEAVDITGGTPSIDFNVNGQTVTATYSSGTGSSTLVFTGAAPSGNGSAISVSAIHLNSATVVATANSARNWDTTILNPTYAGYTLDNTTPMVSSIALSSTTDNTPHSTVTPPVLGIGDVVTATVTMSEAVTVTGTPQLNLTIGATTTVQASYAGGSGTSSLTFTYVILTGQNDSNGIRIPANALSLNGGSVQSLADTSATLTASAVIDNTRYLVDTTPPTAPILALASDTGSSASDHITSNATISVTGLESGASWQYQVDGAGAWVSALASGTSATFIAMSGAHSYTVQQIDLAGNTSAISTAFIYTLDTSAPATPTLSLAADSGSNSVDGITNNATINVSGLESGASWQYQVDGTAGTWQTGTGNSFTASSGTHSYFVRQTDLAGNMGTTNTSHYIFNLETSPTVTQVALTAATGAMNNYLTVGDVITATVTMSLPVTVTGAGTVQLGLLIGSTTVMASYVGGGASATTSLIFTYVIQSGNNDSDGISIPAGSLTLTNATIQDEAGDLVTAAFAVSALNNASYLVDTSAPVAPTLNLAVDSGSSSVDGITSKATINVTGLESGATWQYQVDGAGVWVSATASGTSATFTATSGPHTYTVQQIDLAGNTSSISTVTYTLDNSAPAAPSLSLASDTGSSASDRITSNATINVGALEAGASWQYQVDGAGDWVSAVASGSSASFTASSGAHSYFVQQTDLAGNTGAISTMVTYTLDTTVPAAPSLSLASDTGTNHSDGLTNNATISVTGLETAAGTTWQYQVDTSSWHAGTGNSFTASSGTHSYFVRQIDTAGNSGASSSVVTYTLDNSVPSGIASAGTSSNVAENTTGAVTLTANANDGVANASVTWSLGTGGDTSLFTVTSAGVLSFQNAPNFERPRNAAFNASTNNDTYTVYVIATDAAGNASTATAVLVNVTDVNETPVAVGSVPNQTATQGAEYSFNVSTYFSDPDNEVISAVAANGHWGTLTYTTSNTLPTGLTLSSAGLISGTSASIVSPSTITVTATDGGGMSTTQIFSLSVSNGVVISGFTVSDSVGNTNFGKSGDILTFTVTMSEAANITGGTPTIDFNVNSQTVTATYSSGKGSNILVFTGTAPSGNGNLIRVNAIHLNGATVVAASNSARSWNNTVLNASYANYTLDNTTPTVSNIALTATTDNAPLSTARPPVLGVGDVVTATLTMSEAVTVTGTPQLNLTIGATTVQASYVAPSPAPANGSSSLIFTYVILATQTDSNGIGIPINALSANGGTIQSLAGTSATLTASAVADSASYLVDTTPPTAPTLTLASDTGSNTSDGLTNNATIIVGALEAGASWQYQVDASAWQTGTGNSFTATEGAHTYFVQQSDAAGSAGSVSAFVYTLDTTPPTAPTLSFPNTSTDLTRIGVSGLVGATWTYQVDGGAGTSVSNTMTSISVISDSTLHTYTVQQTDVAGNTSSSSVYLVQGTGTVAYTDTGGLASGTTLYVAGSAGPNTLSSTRTNSKFYAGAGKDTVRLQLQYQQGVSGWSGSVDGGVGTDSVMFDYTNVTAATSIAWSASQFSGIEAFDFSAATATTTFSLTAGVVESARLDSYVWVSDSDWELFNGALYGAGTRPTYQLKITGNEYLTVQAGAGDVWVALTTSSMSGIATNLQTAYYSLNSDILVLIYKPASGGSVHLSGGISVAPSLSLLADTGSSASDGITSNATIRVSGLVSGNTWQYQVDGTTGTWTTATASGTSANFTATSGAHTYFVQQSDAAGSAGSISAFVYTLDTTAPAALTLTLASDTGSSASDRITSNATITVIGLESGATWQYQVDGSGAWVSALASGTSATFTASGGAHTYTVQQNDLAGNTSAISNAFTYTLDTSASAPTLTLASDTGSSRSDGITSNATITVTGLESGATWQYQVDGSGAWVSAVASGASASFIASSGAHSYTVQQIDLVGNTSSVSTAVTYTLDTTVPAAPTLTLLNDTGISASDRITSNATINVTGLEVGATWQYQVDGSGAWTTATASGTSATFIATSGAHSYTVQQTDVAGNTSAILTAVTYTLDTTPPTAPTLTLASDTGSNTSDGLTNNVTISVNSLETGATWQYKVDTSAWQPGTGASFTASSGTHSYTVQQTDVAGNTSAILTAVTYTLDTTPPATPTLKLFSDTGISTSDNITSNATINVTGLESGTTWQYQVDGSAWQAGTGSSFTASSGKHSYFVRQIDTAGNTSTPSASVSYNLNLLAAGVPLSEVGGVVGGLSLLGESSPDHSGTSVAGVGDINRDGYMDFIIGAKDANSSAGQSYVVFGKANWSVQSLYLSAIAAGSGGFVLVGQSDDLSGTQVSTLGDINGDGYADFIIGSSANKSYVVFGKASLSGITSLNLSTIAAGSGGFVLVGEAGSDYSGTQVSTLGDINGDGYADFIIGSLNNKSYVVFGKASWSGTTSLNLSAIAAGSGGFALVGGAGNNGNRASVATLGDINGDGYADFIVGADLLNSSTGKSYVVFGKANWSGITTLNLSTIAAGSGGFVLAGEAGGDSSGTSVAGVGDFNGDGYADFIVGATGANSGTGKSYVVFGKADWSGVTSLNLSTIAAGTGGFVLKGELAGSFSGTSVASAGDINGDGYADLIIGAAGAFTDTGKSYVLFGAASYVQASGGLLMKSSNGVATGTSANEMIVGSSGNDTLIGGGGVDRFFGGAGNDIITLTASDITNLTSTTATEGLLSSVDGGTGLDTIRLTGPTLDLTAIANITAGDPLIHSRIASIERIDLRTDTGTNTLTLNIDDVLDMAGMNSFNTSNGWTNLGGGHALSSSVQKHQLIIEGDAADYLSLSVLGRWSPSQTTPTMPTIRDTVSGPGSDGLSHTYYVYNSLTGNVQLLVDILMTQPL